jgi:hypothetical protein
MKNRRVLAIAVLTLLSTAARAGSIVKVTVFGTVGSNQITDPPLNAAQNADPVTLSFLLDSDVFTNSASFPTRGYAIDLTSFVFSAGAATIGLESPFPAGQTPYFVVRDDDPDVDGFFAATNVDFEVGVPLDQTGFFGPFVNDFSVTYDGSTLSSLDILGALGTYRFSGLSFSRWDVVDGLFSPMDVNFAMMTIELSPVIETYCTSGTSTSGCLASLGATGTPSATASSGFNLTASNVEGAKDGLFFFGANGRQANSWGNGTSYQCVIPPVKRGGLLTGSGTSGACDGSFTQDLNALWNSNVNKNPGSGAVVQAQLWHRDPFNTSNQTTSLSDAVEFTVAP